MRTWSCKARSQGDNEISIQKNREPRYPIGMNSLNASSISIRSPRIPIIPLSFAIRFYFWRLFRIYHLISRNISTIVRASNPSEIEQQVRYQYWKTMLISEYNKRTSFSTGTECVASKRTNRDEWTESRLFL